ncbi:MAG: hypothetical protein AB1465_03280 [Patescibacteria group bacterium]
MKNKDMVRGIGLLYDLVSTMGKTAVIKILDSEATDESLEETRETIKKNFKRKLKAIVSGFFDDEEENKESDNTQKPTAQGDK